MKIQDAFIVLCSRVLFGDVFCSRGDSTLICYSNPTPHLVVPESRVVSGQEGLAEVGRLLHSPGGHAGRARAHHPRRRGRHIPLPLLVLLVLDLQALVLNLRTFDVKSLA